jgi:hypothetical protein
MFYIIIFSILAVVLIVGVLTQANRRRTAMRSETAHTHTDSKDRRTRKAKRAQSRQGRRQRH